MKDEEMADKYAEEKVSNLDECRTKDLMRSVCKDGFLAGLKAGRPQWHDLRENPNDLPYMETELLCQKSSGRCFVGYYSDDNKFHSHETGKSYEIVRWIDIGIWWSIPTFDKE